MRRYSDVRLTDGHYSQTTETTSSQYSAPRRAAPRHAAVVTTRLSVFVEAMRLRGVLYGMVLCTTTLGQRHNSTTTTIRSGRSVGLRHTTGTSCSTVVRGADTCLRVSSWVVHGLLGRDVVRLVVSRYCQCTVSHETDYTAVTVMK